MSHKLAYPTKTSKFILNRHFLEGVNCDPAFRGTGRFLREMREAGFGGLKWDRDLICVDAITGLTRYRGDIASYIAITLAQEPGHHLKVRRGFELIGAQRWAAGIEALHRYGCKLGSARALIEAAMLGDAHIKKLSRFFQSEDINEMSDLRAKWLRARPDVSIEEPSDYRSAFNAQTSYLRRRRAA
ncbi:MAG: hypothetical protein CME88_17755 [Hirschia sp.]|nr:hypothetical protein [Hirschia sp.]MBF19083.1 hypothetical protein [Hirschia sp.]MBF20217.1 hypothetical protein [Hirschia sp.]|tara:strand:+ start:260 stop:817 length:558 start_codon:yes stop_codon:yes gene_type:complete